MEGCRAWFPESRNSSEKPVAKCGVKRCCMLSLIVFSFCESQALNAKADQGQRRSASSVDAATYDCPDSSSPAVNLALLSRGRGSVR